MCLPVNLLKPVLKRKPEGQRDGSEDGSACPVPNRPRIDAWYCVLRSHLPSIKLEADP